MWTTPWTSTPIIVNFFKLRPSHMPYCYNLNSLSFTHAPPHLIFWMFSFYNAISISMQYVSATISYHLSKMYANKKNAYTKPHQHNNTKRYIHLAPIPNPMSPLQRYPQYILHTFKLISIIHASHKHPTTIKILNTNTTQWETHNMEIKANSIYIQSTPNTLTYNLPNMHTTTTWPPP